MLVNNDCHFKNFRRKDMLLPILLVLTLALVECSGNVETSPFFVDSSGNISNSHLNRFRRDGAADKLIPLVGNMQRLARLTNGIALEIGLIDGTISSDSVISELLHMDTLKPKDITDLDPTIIDNALVELDKLHDEVKVSGEVPQIQKRLILLNDVREKAKTFMTDFFKLQDAGGKAESFKAALEAISILDHKKEIQDLSAEINKAAGAMQTLSQLTEEVKADKAATIIGEMSYATDKLIAIQTQAANFDSILTVLEKVKNLKTKSEFMKLIESEEDLRRQLSPKFTPSPEDLAIVKKNFDIVYGVGPKMSQSQASFNTIEKLIASLANFETSELKLTSGLPRGKTDLESLNSDSANSWITERVDDSSVVTASLKRAFTSFDEFTKEFGNVKSKWSILDQGTNRKSLREIFALRTMLITQKKKSEDVTKIVDSLAKCEDGAVFPNPDTAKIKLLQGNVITLNKYVDQINDLKAIEEFKNVSSLIDILKGASDQGDKVEIANKVMAALKADEKFAKIANIAETLRSYLPKHNELIEQVPQLVKLVLTNYRSLRDHHDSVKITKYETFFACLDAVGDQGSNLKESMDLVQKVQLPDATFTEAKSTIKSIVGSKTDLAHFRKSARKMKKVKAPEALALKPNFQKSMEVSQKLSKAVQGLATIKKLQDARKTLDSFSTEVKNLENDKKSWSKEDEEKVRELAKIRDDLDKTLAGVDAFLKELQKVRRRRRSSAYRRKRSQKKKFEFKALGDVLKAAGKVPGVKLALDNLDKIKTTITNIQTTANKNFILPGLDLLKELGQSLDLSTIAFDSSVSSLAAIDLFFTSYGTQMSTVSQSPSGNQSPPLAPGATPAPARIIIVTGTTAPEASNHIGLLIAICVAVLFIAVGAILYFCVCKKKYKKLPDDSWMDDLDKTQLDDETVSSLVSKAVRTIEMLNTEMKQLPTFYGEHILKNLDQSGYLYVDEKQKATKQSQRRHIKYICLESTMPKLVGYEDPFINANEMLLGTKFWIMSQAPQDGTEPEQNRPGKFKKDTCEKFWAMIDQRMVGAIAQTCSLVEDKKPKCAKYYSTQLGGEAVFGRYKVKTIKKETNMAQFPEKKEFVLYTVQYTNTLEPTQNPKTTQILQYTGWPDQGSPVDPAPALAIIRFLDITEQNVVIHCSAGIGRTGTLMCIKYGIKLCQDRIVEDIVDVIKPVRACRYGVIQTQEQITYLVLCITKALMDSQAIPYLRDYDAMYFYHKNNVNGRYAITGEKDRVAEMKQKLADDKTGVEEYCKEKKEEYENEVEAKKQKARDEKKKKDQEAAARIARKF